MSDLNETADLSGLWGTGRVFVLRSYLLQVPDPILFHFLLVSRACAAFFRRKVVECRQIPKRCEGKCKITARRRNSCAHCRFESCLNVFMKMTAVMQRVGSTKSSSIQDNVFLTDPLTLLERLKEAYQKLQEARKATFNLKVCF